MKTKYEALCNNNLINFFWLLLLITSAAVGLVALVVMLLALTNVQILSWTIGYILTSGTNATVLGPSIALTLGCALVLALCLCKKRLLKLFTR